jgi:hypothetical protein
VLRIGYDVPPDEFDQMTPRLSRTRHEPDRQWFRPVLVPNEDGIALAVWVLVSLVGMTLGLLLAKYSQAWAGTGLHPGAPSASW